MRVDGAARRVTFSARDGLQLSANDWAGPAGGGRTPLFCLPGISRTAEDFRGLAERHAGKRRVVALDHAGHGESARAPSIGRYSVEHALHDVQDAMAALHLSRAVLVGTSFGGILSMVLGALRPAALAGVVLNDIGPTIDPGGRGHVEDFIGRDPGFADLDAAVAFLQERLPPLGIEDAAGWRAMAALTYAEGTDGLWHPRWDTRIAQAAKGFGNGVEALLWRCFEALRDLPVLLVHAEISHILSADTAGRMRRAHPGLQVFTLPGFGHSPNLSEPPLRGPVDRFLDEVP